VRENVPEFRATRYLSAWRVPTQTLAQYRIDKIRQDRVAEVPALIEVDADEIAIEHAKLFVDRCDVELWQGARFVIGLKGENTAVEFARSYRSYACLAQPQGTLTNCKGSPNMIGRNNIRWTAEEDHLIRELTAAGKTAQQAALRIRRTEAATKTRAKQLKIKFQNSVRLPWISAGLPRLSKHLFSEAHGTAPRA
jgi:hypothetical protein